MVLGVFRKLLIVTLLLFVQGLFVQDLLAGASDILIDKFTKIQVRLPDNDPSKVPVTLRLADMLSERARQDSVKELESGCISCTAGAADRKQALQYYKEILPKVKVSQKGRILAQMGHLYEMTGNEGKALDLYRKVISNKESPEAAKLEAKLSLAEAYFKRRKYPLAKTYYEQVLNHPLAKRKGLASYKIAWCEFNSGNVEVAIEGLVKILKSPELLSRNSTGIVSVDTQFQSEVSRDLATFYSKRKSGLKEAKLLYQYSPEETRLENVQHLAAELERMGDAPSAVAVYGFVLERQSDPSLRLEGQIRIAQLKYDAGEKTKSLAEYKKALNLWDRSGGCKGENCVEWKARLRKYILDWNRVEKEKPTELLSSAYERYLESFSKEPDVHVWLGQIYEKQSKSEKAIDQYVEAALLQKSGVKAKSSIPTLEPLLLKQIEVAEKSKNKDLRLKAYNNYLASSEKKEKQVEVRYQKAKLIYDSENYAQAAEELRSVALLKEGGNKKIKAQAAHLSLDALSLLKKDAQLSLWASGYSKVFLNGKKEFENIARKSVLNHTAKLSQVKGTGAAQAWTALAGMKVSGASQEDRITYYKNKVILAEKLKKYEDARRAVDALLREKGLVKKDREFALSRKAWLAELFLDFETALNATKKLSLKELKPSQKFLKLAMFADLAGKPSQTYYQNYLKSEQEADKMRAVAAMLVRKSKRPFKVIRRYHKILKGDPNLLGQLYLEAYVEAPKSKTLKKILKDQTIEGTATELVFWRNDYLKKFNPQKERVAKHQIVTSSQGRLSRTLAKRIRLLQNLEKSLNKALEKGDWTAQLLTIHALGVESDRLYNEILSLPVPDGLDAQQQNEYMGLLSQQAAPYQMKAKDLKAKETEFWSNKESISKLQSQLDSTKGKVRELVREEIASLKVVAPPTVQPVLQSLYDRPEVKLVLPSVDTLEKARQNVRNDPMNKKSLEDLMSLEKKMGRTAMAAYLKNRLAKINEEGT